jgi:hypothetical protein
MENLDIILLTTIISVLFLVFIIATFREMNEAPGTPFKGGGESGPRAEMIKLIGKLFTDDRIEPNEKKDLLKKIKDKIEAIDDDSV